MDKNEQMVTVEDMAEVWEEIHNLQKKFAELAFLVKTQDHHIRNLEYELNHSNR